MQRKQGFPVANCSIKMPDSMPAVDGLLEEEEPLQRRQQLVNFGHAQWGFNNWSWSVTKQDLDFVEMTNGKYTAGVVAFVSVTVKTFDIHRENIGYATSLAPNKGSAIHRARKCAVTNALRETLLSFGGSVATELMELLESHRPEIGPEPLVENNQNVINKLPEPKNSPKMNVRKEPCVNAKNIVPQTPPVAKAHPMPVNLQPRAPPRPPAPAPPPAPRPNSNEVKPESITEEEARAERKRRQRQAQEEFRLKHLMKQKETDTQGIDVNSCIDNLLMAIPTQVIMTEDSGNAVDGKRKSPTPDADNVKRRNTESGLNINKK